MRITNKKLSKKQILVATLAVAVAICGSVFALDKIGIISIFPKETVPNISKEPTPQEKKSEEKANQDTKESFLNATKDDEKKSVEESKPAPVPKNNSSIELSANRDGDSVTIIKDLKVKGASSDLKRGTKVKNIRLIDDGIHNIECKIDGFGAMKLKSEFVKKI